MKRFFVLISFFYFNISLCAGTNDQQGLRTLIQDDLGMRAQDEESSEAKLRLLDLFFKPLDINRVQADDLLIIPGVTPALAGRIIQYREERTNIHDLSELRSIEGMDTDIFNRILPFIRGDRGKKKSRLVPVAVNTSFSSKTSPFACFSKNIAFVEKVRIRFDIYEHFRISAAWNDMKMVVPGKAFADLKNVGLLKHLMLGNYKLTFGQGLILGSFGPSKGRDVLRIRNNFSSLIAGDLSSYVNKNFQGAALQFGGGPVVMTGFYSEKKLAAVVEDFVTLGDRENNTPDNVTDDLITDYDPLTIGIPDRNVKKTTYGGRFEFNTSERRTVKGRSGFTIAASRFNLPVRMIYTSDGPFAFTGTELICSGWDWLLSMKEIDFFGEAALSSTHADLEHSGFYAGIAFGQTEFRNTISFRHYGLLFHNFDNAPFSEYGTGRGETGWYFGTAIKPADLTVIQFSGDLFRRNWRSPNELIPPMGWEVSAELRHELFFDLFLHLYATTGQKEKHVTDILLPGNYAYSEDIRVRGDIEWKATYRFAWKAALESVHGSFHDLPNMEKADGNLLYSEFSYLIFKRSEAVIRNEVYEIRNGASISVNEDSSPSVSSYKALFGTGTRHYLFLSYELLGGKNVIYLKTAWTAPMVEVLSGNIQSDINMEENAVKSPSFEIQFQLTSEF